MGLKMHFRQHMEPSLKISGLWKVKVHVEHRKEAPMNEVSSSLIRLLSLSKLIHYKNTDELIPKPLKQMENNGKGVRKGAWTKEEDILLKNCIQKYGEGKWHQVPLRAGLNRCRKSCRLRWLNYLRPDIKRGYFTNDEVDLLQRLHKLLGNRWSLIAGRLPGRTANDVKNFWNSHVVNKSAAAGGNCRRPKTTRQKAVITTTNIIKPRPRTLTIPLLQVPACPSEATKTNESNPKPSSPASLSQEEPNDWEIFNCSENPGNNQQPSPREEVDECNLWWSSLLEITKNGEGATSFTFPDENSQIDRDGFSSLSDVWDLGAINTCDSYSPIRHFMCNNN